MREYDERMQRGRVSRTLIVIAAIVAGVVVAWMALPGRIVDPTALDYVRAFDDLATRSIVVSAAFDAGSFAVIDSCTHQWRTSGELTLEFRSKFLRSRDGRTIRIGAFRVPYPPAGGIPATFAVRGGFESETYPIEPMPAGFSTPVPVIESRPE